MADPFQLIEFGRENSNAVHQAQAKATANRFTRHVQSMQLQRQAVQTASTIKLAQERHDANMELQPLKMFEAETSIASSIFESKSEAINGIMKSFDPQVKALQAELENINQSKILGVHTSVANEKREREVFAQINSINGHRNGLAKELADQSAQFSNTVQGFAKKRGISGFDEEEGQEIDAAPALEATRNMRGAIERATAGIKDTLSEPSTVRVTPEEASSGEIRFAKQLFNKETGDTQLNAPAIEAKARAAKMLDEGGHDSDARKLRDQIKKVGANPELSDSKRAELNKISQGILTQREQDEMKLSEMESQVPSRLRPSAADQEARRISEQNTPGQLRARIATLSKEINSFAFPSNMTFDDPDDPFGKQPPEAVDFEPDFHQTFGDEKAFVELATQRLENVGGPFGTAEKIDLGNSLSTLHKAMSARERQKPEIAPPSRSREQTRVTPGDPVDSSPPTRQQAAAAAPQSISDILEIAKSPVERTGAAAVDNTTDTTAQEPPETSGLIDTPTDAEVQEGLDRMLNSEDPQERLPSGNASTPSAALFPEAVPRESSGLVTEDSGESESKYEIPPEGKSTPRFEVRSSRKKNGTLMRSGRVTLTDSAGSDAGSWNFNTGGFGRGAIPYGTYTVTNPRGRSKRGMVKHGVGFSFDLNDVWDNRVKGTRSLLRIHPDGGSCGTAGCIGIEGKNSTELKSFFDTMKSLVENNGGQYKLVIGKQPA